jgi:hypothetical protein
MVTIKNKKGAVRNSTPSASDGKGQSEPLGKNKKRQFKNVYGLPGKNGAGNHT